MAVAADYSGWVKDLDSFKPSTDDDDDEEDRLQDMSGGYTSKKPTSHASQLDEIKQEMKLLNWHKLANEAALKAALIKTKKLKREDARQLALVDAEEHMDRLQQIEEEENLKPLEVTAELIDITGSNATIHRVTWQRRLEADVSRHITCLKKLKTMLEDREDLRRRHIQYRQGKLALDHGYSLQQESKLTSRSTGNSNDVTRVLSSLDKLVELERRISSLEQDDIEPASAAMVTSSIVKDKGSSTALKFMKTSKGRTTAQPIIAKSKQPKSQSTFLTAVPDKTSRVGLKAKSKELQRAAELRRMPERDRLKARHVDQKQALVARDKQQSVKINQWAQQKKQAAVARKANYVKINQRTAAAATGDKVKGTKNKHMQDFQAMKRDFESKKKKNMAGATMGVKAPLPPVKKRPPPNHTSRSNSGTMMQPWGPKPKPPAEQRLLPMIHGSTYSLLFLRGTQDTKIGIFGIDCPLTQLW
ncbi:hypothetical protein DYB28_006815 [Aphanomyces astaci]|uniref:Uncharacterized protein n=1 Tax=Aphanomyces astaci TaxID=112090 RepID=A0A9X8DVK3_APHAT|nr:hypothetical protein DYB28_006815 [Aphanomyces astaci]